MFRLKKSLHAFGRPEFRKILVEELQQLPIDHLPLQQGLTVSSYVVDEARKVMLIDVREDIDSIHVKAGVFYSGIVAGCSCADDPTPIEKNNEYCELQLDIDKNTAQTRVRLLR